MSDHAIINKAPIQTTVANNEAPITSLGSIAQGLILRGARWLLVLRNAIGRPTFRDSEIKDFDPVR
jgi:hypothetical protein